ncbi:MAG: MFS transporter, partial [Pseudomonas sp.]
EQATWLNAEEKARLRQQLDAEQRSALKARHGSVRDLFGDAKFWALSLVYILMVAGTYAMAFWTPTLIRGWGVSDLLDIGIYATLPQLCAIAGVLLLSRSSDRHRERRWHFSSGALMAVCGLAIMVLAQGQLGASLLGLCLAMLGIASVPPVFFALVSEYLPRPSVAVGIALVSSIGNLGGAVIPSLTSALNTASGGTTYSLYLVMSLYLLASVIVLRVARSPVPAYQSA